MSSRPVALITGSSRGIGRGAAVELARAATHDIVVNYAGNEAAARECQQLCLQAAESKVRVEIVQGDVSKAADRARMLGFVNEAFGRLDLLVNNAGVITPTRQVSVDGHEMQFAVNYLAGYALSYALLPLLERGERPRIVNVSSIAASPLDFTDVMLERGYSSNRAYGQSKLAQVMFTIDLAQELKAKGIGVQALHPATYMDTNMVRSAGGTPRATVDEGAAAVLHAVGTDAPSGSYFVGQRVGTPHAQASDAEARRQLRAISQQLTGLP